MKTITALTGLVGLATIVSSGCPKVNRLENFEVTSPVTLIIDNDKEKLIQYLTTHGHCKDLESKTVIVGQPTVYSPYQRCEINDIPLTNISISSDLKKSNGKKGEQFNELYLTTLNSSDDPGLQWTTYAYDKQPTSFKISYAVVNYNLIVSSTENPAQFFSKKDCTSSDYLEVHLYGTEPSDGIVVTHNMIRDSKCDGIQYSQSSNPKKDSIEDYEGYDTVDYAYILSTNNSLLKTRDNWFSKSENGIPITSATMTRPELSTVQQTFDYLVKYGAQTLTEK
ncbi:MAG: hypothetical protein WC254_04735 [Candidatus Woesearchaeota archaeon]|jgi:hypothetical protein